MRILVLIIVLLLLPHSSQAAEKLGAATPAEQPLSLLITPEGIQFTSATVLYAPSVAGASMPPKGPTALPDNSDGPPPAPATYREAVP